MSAIRTKDDLKALSRSHGMVNAAAADMEVDAATARRNEAQDRVAAARLRELGLSEEKIVAKFGYSPEPFGGGSISSRAPVS